MPIPRLAHSLSSQPHGHEVILHAILQDGGFPDWILTLVKTCCFYPVGPRSIVDSSDGRIPSSKPEGTLPV